LYNMPAFKFSILFICGILSGSGYLFNPLYLIPSILVVIILTIALLNLTIQNKRYFSFLIRALTFLLIFVFGIYKSNLDFFYIEDDSIRFVDDTERKTHAQLTGVLSEFPDNDTGRIRLVLDCSYIITAGDTLDVRGKVIAEIRNDQYKKTKSPQPVLSAGDKVTLKGNLSAPDGMRNPGEFDYRKYLELHGIYKIFNVYGFENIKKISENNSGFLDNNIIFPAKKFTLLNIDRNIKGDEAAFLKGLVTGERGEISPEMKEDFINAGVMHLIAVSGLNVAYIIIFLTLLLSILRIRLVIRTAIIINFLIFYCIFTGSSASIVRASIMGILLLLAFLIERRINFFNVIGISVMIILIYDAKQLYDAGFILSYSATISMAVFLSRFEKLFIAKIRDWNAKGKKFALWTSVLFFTSLAAQIGTIPITAIYFGKLSIISVIANIVAVPLANLSLAIGFFQILTAAFSEYLSSVIAESNNLLLSFQLLFIKICADLDYSFFHVKEFSATDVLCFYLILILILSIKSKMKIFFKLLLCILTVCGNYIYEYDFARNLKLTFLDVGQGDCALIRTPDDKAILVDCGKITFTFNSGERTIAPYLRRCGIHKIDLLIITHLHMDHIGGINYLLENFHIGKIIESGQSVRSAFIDKMDSLIEAKNISRQIVRSGDYIDDFDDLRIYYLFPANNFVTGSGYTIDNNLNNGSVTFILKYKNSEFLFPGDIEKDGERFLYEQYGEFLKTDLLKVAHHGSITSSTIPFIIKNKPDYAVISCGKYNKFNHPSDIVLNRLDKTDAIIHRTDLNGAVIFESDGKSIEVRQWK
ncbi:MAG: DNA internalization-related competence protein ComEC/Rec2, partial [Bacteroidota bacterium]|nr:DNA internalization-related competence protein ComEC/Rec2 [Bacteroidota bacterium]